MLQEGFSMLAVGARRPLEVEVVENLSCCGVFLAFAFFSSRVAIAGR